MSKFNNYEQILCEWLANFVDKNSDGNPLIFRNTAPTLEEVEKFGDKTIVSKQNYKTHTT